MLEDETLAKLSAQGFVAGPFAKSRGKLIALGMGARLSDYTPPALFEPPTGQAQIARERANGTHKRYGTVLLHSTQQMYAVKYGRENMGFGGGPVTFLVNWNWFFPGLFTVAADGSFTQEITESRV